jgi:hypothetical protein
MTCRGMASFNPDMVNRTPRPNRDAEEKLHHSPVTGMLDSVLLDEIRFLRDPSAAALDAAQRAALDMSWRLHDLVFQKAPRS